MADITTNFTSLNIGTAPVTVHTASTALGTIVHGFFIANKTAADINVTVTCAGATIIYQTVVPVNNTLVFDKPITLNSGETMTVVSSVAASCDVFASIVTRA